MGQVGFDFHKLQEPKGNESGFGSRSRRDPWTYKDYGLGRSAPKDKALDFVEAMWGSPRLLDCATAEGCHGSHKSS